MRALLVTEHGRKNRYGYGGQRRVCGDRPIKPENIEFSPYYTEQVEIRTGIEPEDVSVQFSLEELRMVIATLREKGIEVDRERQRLSALVREMSQLLAAPSEQLGEANRVGANHVAPLRAGVRSIRG
jgi:hypothetical protein